MELYHKIIQKQEAGTKGLSKKYTPKLMNYLFSSGSVFFCTFIKANKSGNKFFKKTLLSQPLGFITFDFVDVDRELNAYLWVARMNL